MKQCRINQIIALLKSHISHLVPQKTQTCAGLPLTNRVNTKSKKNNFLFSPESLLLDQKNDTIRKVHISQGPNSAFLHCRLPAFLGVALKFPRLCRKVCIIPIQQISQILFERIPNNCISQTNFISLNVSIRRTKNKMLKYNAPILNSQCNTEPKIVFSVNIGRNMHSICWCPYCNNQALFLCAQ